MMLRLLTPVILGLLICTSHVKAQTITLSLEGYVSEVSATDTDGNDDSALFFSIIPFRLGETVFASMSWDLQDASSTSAIRLFESQNMFVSIGTDNFVADAFRIQVGQNGSSDILWGTPAAFDITSFLPPGWNIELAGSTGSFSRGIFLTDSTGSALDGSNLPTGGLSISDFDSAVFKLSDSSSSSYTWTTPLGTHTGDEHIVLIEFTSLSVTGAPVTEPIILGDVNRDGFVTFADILPFIAVLSSGGEQAEADVDQNGTVDFEDITPFVAILVSQ